MAKTDKGYKHSDIFMLVISIFILHIILAYLVAIGTNYLLIKYNSSEENLFQVNTMSHTFVTILDVMLIAAVLKYFL